MCSLKRTHYLYVSPPKRVIIINITQERSAVRQTTASWSDWPLYVLARSDNGSREAQASASWSAWPVLLLALIPRCSDSSCSVALFLAGRRCVMSTYACHYVQVYESFAVHICPYIGTCGLRIGCTGFAAMPPGRPAGSVERKLTETEIDSLVREIVLPEAFLLKDM